MTILLVSVLLLAGVPAGVFREQAVPGGGGGGPGALSAHCPRQGGPGPEEQDPAGTRYRTVSIFSKQSLILKLGVALWYLVES